MFITYKHFQITSKRSVAQEMMERSLKDEIDGLKWLIILSISKVKVVFEANDVVQEANDNAFEEFLEELFTISTPYTSLLLGTWMKNPPEDVGEIK